ncbi:MAG: PA14 domain-containing protein, partial [Cytophagaceae bacterium]
IHGTSYYDQAPRFTDVMKSSGNWITFNASGSSPWDTHQRNAMPKDVNGYPTRIPFTPSGGVPQACRFMINNYYVGKYVILYDGVGRLRVNGGVSSSVSNGKIYLDFTGQGNNSWIDILESQEGNHIRNIRILPVEYENSPNSAPLFLQEFLDGLEPFHTLRFMDWTKTNDSNQEIWTDRPTPSSHTQASVGTSIEYAIELCNILKVDAWFCTPHKADDNYIRNFAKLVKEQLDPSLKVYIEASNELWNWQFTQAKYVLDNAPGHRNAYVSQDLAKLGAAGTNHPEKDAYMMARTFRIWEEEFSKDRLIRVATGQHSYMATSRRVLEYLFKVDKKGCDMYSVGGYFNFDRADHPKWLESCQTGNLVKPAEIIESAHRQFEKGEKTWTLRTAEIVNEYPGVAYSVYEGGQHMQPHRQEVHCYNQSVYDAQIHPDIYGMYMKNFENHVDPIVNCQLFMAFSYASRREHRYGSWGHLENFGQLKQDLRKVAPKYQALLDANTPKGTTPPPPNPITLRNPDNPASTVNGIHSAYYEGIWNRLPDFSTLTPVKEENLTNFSIASAQQADHFAFRFTGYIDVPADGEYTFFTNSDDGSKLYIGTTTVVDNDGLHAAREVSGKIGLKKGKHAITVEYFENTGNHILQVSFAGPGINKTLIPNNALYRIGRENQPPLVSITSPSNNAEFLAGSDVTITASASDEDGTVSKVEFFAGATKIGEVENEPYTIIWSNVQAGTYSVTAKATDNDGASTISTARNIVVNTQVLP